MRFLENRPIAYVVLAAAIILSLIFGGGGALMDKRADAEAVFNANSFSISAELQEMRDNAVTLLSIAKKYDDANEEYVARLESAVSDLENAGSIAEKHAASLQLDSAIEHVYSDLSSLKLSEIDVEDVRYKYKNFTSAQMRISHDPYNEKAAAFNKELSAFPASILGMLRGVKPLDLFQ